MNNPLMIRSMCARCGEDLEVYYGATTDVLIADVTPCSKCLQSQTEDMIEKLEEAIVIPGQKFYDGLDVAIEIIKERAEL